MSNFRSYFQLDIEIEDDIFEEELEAPFTSGVLLLSDSDSESLSPSPPVVAPLEELTDSSDPVPSQELVQSEQEFFQELEFEMGIFQLSTSSFFPQLEASESYLDAPDLDSQNLVFSEDSSNLVFSEDSYHSWTSEEIIQSYSEEYTPTQATAHLPPIVTTWEESIPPSNPSPAPSLPPATKLPLLKLYDLRRQFTGLPPELAQYGIKKLNPIH